MPALPQHLREKALLQSLGNANVESKTFWRLVKECLNLRLQDDPVFTEAVNKYSASQNFPAAWNIAMIVAQAMGSAYPSFRSLDVGSRAEVVHAFQCLFDLTYKNVITKDRRSGPLPSRFQVTGVVRCRMCRSGSTTRSGGRPLLERWR